MKKTVVLLFILIFTLFSCKPGNVQNETEPPESETEAVSAVKGTEPAETEDENEVFEYACAEYILKYPRGFSYTENEGALTLSQTSGKNRAVTVKKTDIAATAALSYKTTAQAIVEEAGGTLLSEARDTELGGVFAVRFSYSSNGAYITEYLCSVSGTVYIVCTASYDKNDDLPLRIAQTIQFIS